MPTLFVVLLTLLVGVVFEGEAQGYPTKKQDWQPLTNLPLPTPTALASAQKLADLIVVLGGAGQSPTGEGAFLDEERRRVHDLQQATAHADRISSTAGADMSEEELQRLVRDALMKDSGHYVNTHQGSNGYEDPLMSFATYLSTVVQPNITVLSVSDERFLDVFFIAAEVPPPNSTTDPTSSASYPSDHFGGAATAATSSVDGGQEGKTEQASPFGVADDPPASTTTPTTLPPFPPPSSVLPALLDYPSMGIYSSVVVDNSLFTLGMCTTIPSTVHISPSDETLMAYLRNVQRLDLLIPRNRNAPSTTTTPTTTPATNDTTTTTAPVMGSGGSSSAVEEGGDFLGTSGLYISDHEEEELHAAARRTLRVASETVVGGRGLGNNNKGRRRVFKKRPPPRISPHDEDVIRFYSTNPAATPSVASTSSDPFTHAVSAGALRQAHRDGPNRRTASRRIRELHTSVGKVTNAHRFSPMSVEVRAQYDSDVSELESLLGGEDGFVEGTTTGGLYFSSTSFSITAEMVKYPRFNASCVAYGGNIYIVGGVQLDAKGGMTLSKSIDLFVPGSNKFVSGAFSLEYAGMSLGVASDDSLIYVTGGYQDAATDSTCFDTTYSVEVMSQKKLAQSSNQQHQHVPASPPLYRTYNTTKWVPYADASPSQRVAAASTLNHAETLTTTTMIPVLEEVTVGVLAPVTLRSSITFRDMITQNQVCWKASQQSLIHDESPHVFVTNGTIFSCFSHCAAILTPQLRTFINDFGDYNFISMTPTSAYYAPMTAFVEADGTIDLYLVGGYFANSGTVMGVIFRAELNQASSFEANVFGFHFYPQTSTTTTTTTTPTTTATTTSTSTTTTTTPTSTTTTTTPTTTTTTTTSTTTPTTTPTTATTDVNSTTTTTLPPPPVLHGVRYVDRGMEAASVAKSNSPIVLADDPPVPTFPDNDGAFNNLVNHFRPMWVDTPFYILFEGTVPPAAFDSDPIKYQNASNTTATTAPPAPPLFLPQCDGKDVFCVLRISADTSCSTSLIPETRIDNTTITSDFPVAQDAPAHTALTGLGPMTIPASALHPLANRDGERTGWFGGVTAYVCISLGQVDLAPLRICNAGTDCESYFITPLNGAEPFLIMSISDYVPATPSTSTTSTTAPPNGPGDDDGLSKVTLSYIIIGAVVVACMGIAGVFLTRHLRELRREREDADERGRLLESTVGGAGSASGGQAQLLDGKYRVLQRLGKGSFSVVYLVERVTDQRRFALKYVLCADDLDRTEAIKECDVIHKLQGHPNVIQLFDMFMSYRFDALSSGTINNGAPGRSGGQSRGTLQKKKSYDVHDDEYLRNPIVVHRGNNASDEQNANIAANGERYLSLVMEYHEKGDVGKYIRGIRQYTQRLLHTGGQALNPIHHNQQLKQQLQSQNNGKQTKKQRQETAAILARPPFAEITISEGMVVSIAYQVLSVLHFMHARSPPIIHRDLKPENLLMSSDEYDNVNVDEFLPVVVTDFGLSRVMDATFCETGVGSLPYVAPECWHRQYSTKIDIWALGCILYGICTRRVAADNVKVMFADCSRPDFKASLKRDLSELSTVAFGLLTPQQLAQAMRHSASDSPGVSSRRIVSGGLSDPETSGPSTDATMKNPSASAAAVAAAAPADSASSDRPQYLQSYSPQLATFILSMLEPDPNLRPTASQLLLGIKKVYQRRGPGGTVSTVDRNGDGSGLRDSGESMSSNVPPTGSVGAVYGKGAAATGKDIQLDAQCVFYIDPEFTEIKDNGMPPASVSASFLSKSKTPRGSASKSPTAPPAKSPQSTPYTPPAYTPLTTDTATLPPPMMQQDERRRSDVGSLNNDFSDIDEQQSGLQ